MAASPAWSVSFRSPGGGRKFGDSADWKITQTREHRPQIVVNRPRRRQVSTIEMMAATRGPASTPRCEGAGPRIAAIISVIETCWGLRIRPRDYFDAILPGLADFPVKSRRRVRSHCLGPNSPAPFPTLVQNGVNHGDPRPDRVIRPLHQSGDPSGRLTCNRTCRRPVCPGSITVQAADGPEENSILLTHAALTPVDRWRGWVDSSGNICALCLVRLG